MAQEKAAASPRPGPVTYRTLGVFWAAVLGLGAAGAGALSALGPVGPAPRDAARGKTVVASAAAMAPDRPAAPQLTTVPPPNPDLLEELPADFPDRTGAKLPKVAANGRKPAKYYAASFDPADHGRHIALAVGTAGADQDLTLRLLHELPPQVDIVFSAYMPPERAPDLARAARDAGHECLISIPMEPAGVTPADEGQHQLTSVMSGDDLQSNLEWDLSLLGGCVGATGAADNGRRGDRFVHDSMFKAVLVEVTKRGMLYLDSGTGVTLLNPSLAPAELPVPGDISLARKPDVVLDDADDAPLGEDAIRANLGKLEQFAMTDHPGVGLAVNLNAKLIDVLRDWAGKLPGRGITLIPLSATPPIPPPTIKVQEPPNPDK